MATDIPAQILGDDEAAVLQYFRGVDDRARFLESTRVGVGEIERASTILARLVRWGWLESTHQGRRWAYRLTKAGAAQVDSLPVYFAQREQERSAAWEAEHLVYGVPRSVDAPPLTERQTREWVRGYLMEAIGQVPVPADAPAEVKASFEQHRAFLNRRLSAHRPDFAGGKS